MVENSYVPFLKLKVNEVAGYYQLTDKVKNSIVPFFDFPIRKGLNEATFSLMIDKAAVKLKKYVGDRPFFIDSLDIPDDVIIDGAHCYGSVLRSFIGLNFIPVVGLDRALEHNEAVMNAKRDGVIVGETIAIRILPEEFLSFSLVEAELRELLSSGEGLFSRWILIVDCRMCLGSDCEQIANNVIAFINKAHSSVGFDSYVLAGSSIPASAAEIIRVGTKVVLPRGEILIFQKASKAVVPELTFGDYTVVSPLYSDVDIPPEMLLNVTTPKVAYSAAADHIFWRGGALRTHPRGSYQFNDIAAQLISESFYRTPTYSYGDHWLNEKSVVGGKKVTPGSVLAPTINAHIAYMVVGQPFR